MKLTLFLCGLLFLMVPVNTVATTVSVRVTDGNSGDLQNQLVIIRSLEGYREFLRALTDSSGLVPLCELPRGNYQLIVSEPYGLWKTHVDEFSVSETPLKIEIKMELLPTHGMGDVEVIAPDADLSVMDSTGKPVPEAQVFVRDSEALYGQWYKTDHNGKVTVHPFGDGSEFVVFFGGKITRYQFKASDEVAQAKRALDDCFIKSEKETAKQNRQIFIHLN